jgi:Type II secretion system protein B
MSFILDALKKAESERSRKSGPVLMDVRIAAPRRRLPGWAWVLGSVLLANLLVLAWLLLRTPTSNTVAPAPVIAATPPAAVPQAAAPAPGYAVPAPTLAAQGQGLQPTLPPPLATVAADTAPAVITPESALDVDNLPTYQDLVAAGISLPPLALNLHVYDANPGNRYVLLNAMRLREGDLTPDGIRLMRITPRGAVLDLRGRRFMLTAGG